MMIGGRRCKSEGRRCSEIDNNVGLLMTHRKAQSGISTRVSRQMDELVDR